MNYYKRGKKKTMNFKKLNEQLDTLLENEEVSQEDITNSIENTLKEIFGQCEIESQTEDKIIFLASYDFDGFNINCEVEFYPKKELIVTQSWGSGEEGSFEGGSTIHRMDFQSIRDGIMTGVNDCVPQGKSILRVQQNESTELETIKGVDSCHEGFEDMVKGAYAMSSPETALKIEELVNSRDTEGLAQLIYERLKNVGDEKTGVGVLNILMALILNGNRG